MLAVSKSMSSYELKSAASSFECILVLVTTGPSMKTMIACVYIPPQQPSAVYQEFFNVVEEVLYQSGECVSSVLVCGDFNLPNSN